VGTRGPSGREAFGGAEGLANAAASATGHRSVEGKGGGPSGREAAGGAEGLTITAPSAAGVGHLEVKEKVPVAARRLEGQRA
jgi:hypothetical protein